MRYLSVCSGIEAASVAWEPLGWTPVAFSEIEPFPAAVLAHRFPNVPNLGDMTKHAGWTLHAGAVDLLVGGTPCQSFSVAGLRKGLHDPRGGLMLTYLEIAQRLRPRWIVWENVPGVLSSGGGRDFGSFLGALGELGYGWAYRVLDAQWVRTQRHSRAVPQRRRRVFVVGCLGDWNAAAAVLFERESVRRDSAPRRAKGQGVAPNAEAGVGAGRWPARVSCTFNHAFGTKLGLEDQHALHGAPMFVPSVVGALTAKGPEAMGAPEVDAQHYIAKPTWWDGGDCASTLTKQNANGAQRMPDKDNFGAVLQPYFIDRASFNQGQNAQYEAQINNDGLALSLVARGPGAVAIGTDCYNGAITGDVAATMGTPGSSVNASGPTVMAFTQHGVVAGSSTARHDSSPCADRGQNMVACPTLTAHNDPSRSPQSSEVTQQVAAVHATTMTVRRLTPRECERLQGFPDDWTMIPWRKKTADECPDGPRYKALGNSMAVNCMEWIGERIVRYESK